MLLPCSFFRLKELFQVKNGSILWVLSFCFFLNAKNLGQSDAAKWREKKEDGLTWKLNNTLQ